MKNESQLDDFKNMLESASVNYDEWIDSSTGFIYIDVKDCEYRFDSYGNLEMIYNERD